MSDPSSVCGQSFVHRLARITSKCARAGKDLDGQDLSDPGAYGVVRIGIFSTDGGGG